MWRRYMCTRTAVPIFIERISGVRRKVCQGFIVAVLVVVRLLPQRAGVVLCGVLCDDGNSYGDDAAVGDRKRRRVGCPPLRLSYCTLALAAPCGPILPFSPWFCCWYIKMPLLLPASAYATCTNISNGKRNVQCSQNLL